MAERSAPLCERWIPAQGEPRAVVLLTHGMNLRPDRMDQLGEALAARGLEVFRAAFSGHCGDGARMRRIAADDWEADARRLHDRALQRARKLSVPLQLTAYSFSGLVFQTMEAELPFSRRALFAPPLSTRFWYPLVVWFARLFPDLGFGTVIPEGYYANARGGLRSILALDVFYQRWRQGSGSGAGAPALIWIDPADELVSAAGVQAEAAARPGWRYEALSTAGARHAKRYHHLIIDEASLGEREWARVSGLTAEFLLAK